MEERVGVLVQNEKHANKSVAKVMRRRYMDERCVSCI